MRRGSGLLATFFYYCPVLLGVMAGLYLKKDDWPLSLILCFVGMGVINLNCNLACARSDNECEKLKEELMEARRMFASLKDGGSLN